MGNIDFNLSQNEFDEKVSEHDYIFGFAIDSDSDGTTFQAMIAVKGDVATVDVPYENIDAYIYALEDIKQRLEILRMRKES